MAPPVASSVVVPMLSSRRTERSSADEITVFPPLAVPMRSTNVPASRLTSPCANRLPPSIAFADARLIVPSATRVGTGVPLASVNSAIPMLSALITMSRPALTTPSALAAPAASMSTSSKASSPVTLVSPPCVRMLLPPAVTPRPSVVAPLRPMVPLASAMISSPADRVVASILLPDDRTISDPSVAELPSPTVIVKPPKPDEAGGV